MRAARPEISPSEGGVCARFLESLRDPLFLLLLRLSAEPFHLVIRGTLQVGEHLRRHAKNCRDQIRKTRLDVDDPSKSGDDLIPGIRATAAFAGSESCAKCHPGAEHGWRETGHARAFSTLVKHGKEGAAR